MLGRLLVAGPGAASAKKREQAEPRSGAGGGGGLRHEAWFDVQAPSAKRAGALFQALRVEADDPLEGARIRLERQAADAASFTIHVVAQDVAHLRAATNSFLKWLSAADASLEAAADRSVDA